jgi:hypothetical protein
LSLEGTKTLAGNLFTCCRAGELRGICNQSAIKNLAYLHVKILPVKTGYQPFYWSSLQLSPLEG